MNSKFKALIVATESQNHANRLSSPNRQQRTEPVLSKPVLSSIEGVEGNNELLTSIENQTLAHFRHFSSLFTNFPSTTVESALQIAHFMQNKPNFRKAQMNVTKALTRDYEKKTLGQRGKNKPNTKPIQTQSNPIKANKMPKQTQYKPKQTQFAVSLPALSVVEGSNLFQRQKMRMRLTINGWCKSFGYLRSFCAKKNGVVPPPVRPRILLTKPALPNFQYRQHRFWNLPKSGGPISSSSFFIRF